MIREIHELLSALDEHPTIAAYANAAREVQKWRGKLRRLRVGWLASYTIDAAVSYNEVEASRHGFALDIYRGGFNTVNQELLSEDGEVTTRADVVFISQLLEDVSPALASGYLQLTPAGVEEQIERVVSETVAAIGAFRSRSNAAVVVHNFALPTYPVLGIFEPMVADSQTKAVRSLNSRLAAELSSIPDVYVLDFDRLCAAIGYANWRNDKMWHLGRAPLSAATMRELARLQADFLNAIAGTRRKCLVLDLDNTLWGGILGEVGVAGISLGQTYPGSVYREFQQAALQLYHRGILLAINSKNNAAEVEQVFSSHPDMVLRREHFVSVRVNWQSKTENMLAIAREAGIGLESLVFFDDNPVERALMRAVYPQVLTIEVPSDALAYVKTLQESRAFDKLSFTAEDRRRGAMYQERAQRVELERASVSVGDFLNALQMRMTITPVDDFTFPRVLDLIHKTNQFNLTVRRHSASELRAIMMDTNCGVFAVRLADRFGDHGIVGAAIVRLSGSTAHIDTLLLSCRVIGRTVETAILAFIVEWAMIRGSSRIEGEFVSTSKNAPAADLYERHGFALAAAAGDHGQLNRWSLNVASAGIEWPPYIRKELR